MRRTTIKDIAKAAGVSPGAVSFALNDRPGVSEETRARIKQVAAELGWTRSAAAAALSGQRAGALGLVVLHGDGDDYNESFLIRFMGGVHRVLRETNQSMVFQMVADDEAALSAYRTWWGEGRVDGVLLLRPTMDDPRRTVLAELGMPGVVVGAPAGERISSVCSDEPAITQLLVDHFAHLGHRSIAYVAGPADRYYIRWRAESFLTRAEQQGMQTSMVHVDTEDEAHGMRASRGLVRGSNGPTAVLYDNELLAMGGLAACHDAGKQVGRDLCMATFEDSVMCRMSRPAISALRRRTEDVGELAARSLLDLIDTGTPDVRIAPLPELAVRASSGLARDDLAALRARSAQLGDLPPGSFQRETNPLGA